MNFLFKYTLVLIILFTSYGISSVNAVSEETIRIIEHKDRLEEQGINNQYINSFSKYIIGGITNAYIDILARYKDDITLNSQNTYFTGDSYGFEAISLDNSVITGNIGIIHNNNDSLDTINSINIGSDYYAYNQLAPKNPTSILPIYDPCDRVIDLSGFISYTNCNTFITTETRPLFVSYFENGDEHQGGGYTIVELRDKSTNNIVNRFFIGGSQATNTTVEGVLNKSYTFGLLQEQDRNALYIPNGGGNINLDSITISSFDNLSVGEYIVFFQNINKFGLRSDKIKAGYLEIIPPEGPLQDFILNTVNKEGEATLFTIVNREVSINFLSKAQVRITNPGGYDYNVEPLFHTNIKITPAGFNVSHLNQGVNIFNIEILDEAGDVIDNRSLIINVDTIAPEIKNVEIDQTYLTKLTIDNKKAVFKYLGIDHVNNNISFSGSDIGNLVPVSIFLDELDNGIQIQYSPHENGIYQYPGLIEVKSDSFTIYVDSSFVTVDGDVAFYFRAIDIAGNISAPNILNFAINREAKTPIIITNDGGDIITSQKTMNLGIELDWDTTKVIYNGLNLSQYEPLSTLFDVEVPLSLGEIIYPFYAIDFMGNISPEAYVTIIKNPTPREGVYGTDKTIKFEGGVTTDQINLQRVTDDGSAGEIFSR